MEIYRPSEFSLTLKHRYVVVALLAVECLKLTVLLVPQPFKSISTIDPPACSSGLAWVEDLETVILGWRMRKLERAANDGIWVRRARASSMGLCCPSARPFVAGVWAASQCLVVHFFCLYVIFLNLPVILFCLGVRTPFRFLLFLLFAQGCS
jgi:hypothetical protein